MPSPQNPLSTGGASFMPCRRHRLRRAMAIAIGIGLACMALVGHAPAAGASTTLARPTPDVGILPFPGDVYIAGQDSTLIPVDPSSTPTSAPLYNLAGQPLNLTWGQFSSATAKSYAWTVIHRGVTSTQFLIALSGLVPGGVYSLFYRTFGPDSNNVFCPNVEPSIALTAAFPQFQQPDPDSFVASSLGRAIFFASVAQDLLAAQQLQASVIYHFDGKTYGPLANAEEAQGPVASNGGLCRSSYGIDAMRQFLIIQK
jgi:hypothetical protein